MARKARKNYASGFMHVMVQGLNKEFIFNTDEDIKKYLKILKKSYNDDEIVDVQVIAYCVMNNHVHLLINYKDIKFVSKLMQKINTKYAKYYNEKYNRCGYVFRDRFKSEEICDVDYLIGCVKYIHNNPVKANICVKAGQYRYSSYSEYKKYSVNNIVNKKEIVKLINSYGIDYDCFFQEKEEKMNFLEYYCVGNSNETIKNVVNEFMKVHNIGIIELKRCLKMFKEIIEILYNENNISQKEIADYFNISCSKISKIIAGKTNRIR